jgi:hypothetical protein
MTQYAERVCRGAELLDMDRPGWEREIDVSDLAMSSCDRCILGQLYRDFYSGLRRLSLAFGRMAWDHGFTGFGMEEFACLASAWRREIRARLEREAVPT